MDNIGFLIAGIVMTAIGVIYPALTLKRKAACKASVSATVVKVEKKTHYNGDKTIYKYLPTFSYTVNGKEYVAKSDVETMNRLKYKEGDAVAVRYDPDAPEIICAGKRVFPYVCGALFAAFGVALIVCSL